MTSTPKSAGGESLNESWVDVNESHATLQTTPVHIGGSLYGRSIIASGVIQQNMERLLWEAQKESANSSAVASGRNSHSISPKSATSPVYALGSQSPVDSIGLSKEELIERNKIMGQTDWFWDWTTNNTNEQLIKREWRLSQIGLKKNRLSLRQWAVRRGIFSKEVLSLLLLTNILSLILGAGLGYTILVRRTI